MFLFSGAAGFLPLPPAQQGEFSVHRGLPRFFVTKHAHNLLQNVHTSFLRGQAIVGGYNLLFIFWGCSFIMNEAMNTERGDYIHLLTYKLVFIPFVLLAKQLTHV